MILLILKIEKETFITFNRIVAKNYPYQFLMMISGYKGGLNKWY
ncbi:Uncharacterised protein [uncultured archaeon]|nr:Uncharacterised protein [uncultured archaeon]